MSVNRSRHECPGGRTAVLAATILLAVLTAPVSFHAQTDPPFALIPPCTIPPAPPGSDTWPVAVTDSLGTMTNASVTFQGATLVANDLGTSLTLVSVGPTSSGGGTVTGSDPFTFTVAPGFNGADVFPYEIRDAAGQTAVGLVKVTSIGDTIFPAASIMAPVNGETVSGTVLIKASATDNIGIAGVRFFDGASQIGPEVTVAPYQASWDTTRVSNGGHSLKVVAQDPSGNSTTSDPVGVIVANVINVTVPNIVGLTETAAKSAITGANLSVGTVTTSYHATVAAGLVISQDPSAGSSAAPQSAVAFVVSLGPAPAPAPGGLVLSLSFDTANGTTVSDTSGFGNNGTIRGAVAAAGKVGRALQFDGIDDWVTVADANSLDLTNGMTLEAWVNPTAFSGWETVLLKQRGTGDLSYALYAHDATSGPAEFINVGGNHQSVGGPALALGVWTHLAVTYDAAMQHLYINGAHVASRPQTGNIAVSAGVLRIGGNSSFANEFFAGRIDEVKVYNRALTTAQIIADMNGTAAPPTDPPPPPPPPPGSTGPVLALGFNEAAGATVASDSSGGGRNGTVREAQFVAGKYGNALWFDGVNDWVTVPDSDALDLTTAMTVEAWVNPAAVNGWETVVLKERGAGDLAYALYSADGTAAKGGVDGPAGYANIGEEHRAVRRAAGLELGVWSHVATTYDGSTERLYINGVLVASRAQTGTIAVSTGALRIGGNNSWAGEFFQGLIDEVRVYNRALSDAEVTTDMNTPLP